MNILFIDCETNGRPKNYKAHHTDVDNWPRVISFAYQIANSESGEAIKEFHSFVTPDGWEVPREQFWIDHGYSTEKCKSEGIPMPFILDDLINKVEKSGIELIVSHNIHFDHTVLSAEMVRYKRRASKIVEKGCTMQAGVIVCKIPFPGTRERRPGLAHYKWPTLGELYQKLFDKEMTGAHDALADVNACRECFFEMVNRNIIELVPNLVLWKS